MLTDFGYRVIEPASAEDALQLVADGLEPQLLVTDHLMPGIMALNCSPASPTLAGTAPPNHLRLCRRRRSSA